MDYLVPEMQSYHLDMGSLSGAGEMDPAMHFRDLYGGRGQASRFVAVNIDLLIIHELIVQFRDLLYGSRQETGELLQNVVMHLRDLYGVRGQTSCLTGCVSASYVMVHVS